MDAIDANTPIGEVVSTHPGTARLFERLGLDYCCGGDRSLGAACASEGLDAATVVRMLEATLEAKPDAPADSTDWTEAPLDALIEHIESTHHAYLRRELPHLEDLLDTVVRAHGTDAPWLGTVKDVFGDLKPAMEAHIRKEEEVVFPFIRRLTDDPSTPVPDDFDEEPIALMEEEHDETGAALERMRALSDDFTVPEWGCRRFRALLDGLDRLEADTHRHVHKENNILFPRARALA